jgi:hypothetical protein
MGTVLRFPQERCRSRSTDTVAPVGKVGNVVILPAVRIERHQPESDTPLAEVRRTGRTRRRRSPRS